MKLTNFVNIQIFLIILFFYLTIASSRATEYELEFDDDELSTDNATQSHRTSRYFPMLAVVRLPNSICTINGQQGACKTSKQCKKDGGTSIGTCGNGYGVCCTISASCSPTNNQQPRRIWTSGTHLTTPTMYTTPFPCQFEIPKREGVCQVRLDFLGFNLAGPDITGNCFTDSMTITGAVNLQNFMACGAAPGQHLYLHYGTSDRILVNLNLGTPNSVNQLSTYDILVTLIGCAGTNQSKNNKDKYRANRSLFHNDNNNNKNWDNNKNNNNNNNMNMNNDNIIEAAPFGCTQYYTRSSDRVASFNFVDVPNIQQNTEQAQINNEMYTVCVKTTSGSNTITWSPCPMTTTPFFISGPPTTTPCTNDYVDIPGSQIGRYCGASFPPIVSSSAKPFMMYVQFNDEELFGYNLPIDPKTGCPVTFLCYKNGIPQPIPGQDPCVDGSMDSCRPSQTALDQSDWFNTGFCLQYTVT